MNKKDLNQMYYINKEIEMWRNALTRLENMSLYPTGEISGMPFGSGTSDKVGDLAVKKADIKQKINELLNKQLETYVSLTEYIQSIDDSMLRQIMYHRHVLCMTWNQVARAVGGGNTAESVRKNHDRFLEEN